MTSGIIITGIKNFIVSFLILIGMVVTPSYYKEAKELVSNINEDTFKSAQTTLAYDKDGQVITKLKDEKDSYYISYATIPQYVKDAFVATEDKSFFKHNGVDITGVGRAFFNLIKNGRISGGGSTITQQLARNVFLTHEKSFERKLKEIYISYELEKNHTKQDILEYYINSIYFSNGAYGIDAASRKYFGKPATDLTLGESAFLCAIPNNPTLYNPINNYENTVKRQIRVLGYMLEDGYITDEEYNNALNEEIVITGENINSNNYVDTYIIECATEAIMEMDGFEFKNSFASKNEEENYKSKLQEAKKEAQDKLYSNGYRIYTSIDMDKQEKLQAAVDSTLASFTEKTADGIYTMQGAATSIDNETGKVVAIVGGRSQENMKYSFNRAFQSYRQPGSIIKPILLYTPLFENGYYPSTYVLDEKSENGPKNYNDAYEGMISIRYAVEQSKNTVAWNLLRELGVNKAFEYLEKMNFKKIVKDDYNLAAALGGLTYGTNTTEMAGAYTALVKDGKYVKPTCIIKITDADGNVLYEDNKEYVEVYTQRASRIMTDVLRTTSLYGTGVNMQLNNMTSAGKTGSTNDNRDGWYAGFSNYNTTIVWVGCDTPKYVEGLYGSTYPGSIWKQYMNDIHEGLENKEFPIYEELASEEETIRVQEEQKVLDYELSVRIPEFISMEVNSYDTIVNAENIYFELYDKASRLIDENKKTGYINQLYEKKVYIDEQKPWYYFIFQ